MAPVVLISLRLLKCWKNKLKTLADLTESKFVIPKFKETEYIYSIGDITYVKSSQNNVDILDSSMKSCKSIEAKDSKCIVKLSDATYIGCWNSKIQKIDSSGE